MSEWPAVSRWILLTLLVALALRVLVTAINWSQPEPAIIHPDSPSYIETAASLATTLSVVDENGSPDWGRPPGYPGFLAVLFASRLASPTRLGMVVVLQICLSLLIILAATRLAWLLAGPRAALVTAFVAAVEPSSITYTNLVMSETWFTFVLMAGILAWWRWQRTPTLANLLLVGSLFGLMPLIRPAAQYFAPLLAILGIWLVPRLWRGKRWQVAALLLALALAPAAFWSGRNLMTQGVAALDHRNARVRALFARDVEDFAGIPRPAAAAGPYPWELTFAPLTRLSHPEIMRIRADYFRRTVQAHPFSAAGRLALTGIQIVGTPDSQLPPMLLDRIPPLEPGVRGRLAWLGQLGLLAPWLLAGMAISVLGCALLPLVAYRMWGIGGSRRAMLILVAVLMLYLLGVSSFVAHQAERYRVPVIPLCALMLGLGLVKPEAAGARETETPG